MTRQGDGADRLARLAASIRSEIDRLVAVVAEAELALRDFSEITPPLRELRGIGDIVHDFYTGIERIFEKIAPELNGWGVMSADRVGQRQRLPVIVEQVLEPTPPPFRRGCPSR